jgi:peroxiredoxin Q/BCP
MRKKPLLSLLIFLSLSVFVNGQEVVNFKLESATGNSKFMSKEAKGKFVALHFLLKTECPYCIRHTHDYINKSEKLPNVIQVFIKPDTEEEINAWVAKISAENLENFPIYRDPDAKLAKRFNIPEGYEFHNQVVHYPALVLLNPEGEEVFRYIGKNNSDRYSFEQLKQKVKSLL